MYYDDAGTGFLWLDALPDAMAAKIKISTHGDQE